MNQTISLNELTHEIVGGEPYDYFPLGNYVVRAVGVCGGRPTFKYTRIEISFILGLIATGHTVDQLVTSYDHPHLTHEAIYEAMTIANQTFISSPIATKPLAA